jgi:Ca2+-binding RTX toxin-like protein
MSFLPKWAALVAALASIALMLSPAWASATVTTEVPQASKLIVKGDGQNDEITLTVVGGKIAVTGVVTPVDADANAELVVEAGGGDDTVNASALVAGNYKSLVASGGEGNDKITGGAIDGDVLNGDDGNDTLVGAKGTDTDNGGLGDDVMVWNNGDGNDTNNGDAGTDESVFNGANGAPNNLDTITVAPQAAPNNDRVLLKRTTPTIIEIDIKAEKVSVNGLAGEDKLAGAVGLGNTTPPLIALALSGGEGNDELTGGDGADTLNGDDGNDTLVGAKGTDTANGGNGDDVMVWNNGDGNDTNNGDAGTDESVFNGANTAPNNLDTITVAPQAAPKDDRVLLKRTTPTLIEIDIKAEKVSVNGLAGEDKLAGAVGLGSTTPPLIALALSGGEGNDELTGGDGADALSGGNENDKIVGAKGNDIIRAGEGDDLMIWNNGDGSDEDFGEAGVDTVESNGNTAAENYTYKLAARPNWVRFDRLANAEGKGAFFIEFIDAEKFVVNTLAGDDHLEAPAPGTGLAALTAMTINAGEGNDTVLGGDGKDTFNGEKGNDVLAGGKGPDTISGGEGDDEMVWNNGDNSDEDFGEAGDDEVVVNGSPTAGDVVTYKPVNAAEAANVRVLFARTNLVPFTVNFDAEHLTINGLGGDDTMTPDAASPTGLATRTTLALDGGEGNDTMSGGDGNDTLTGGPGSDLIEGQVGNDQLMARDNENDLVRGGAGDDSAQTDAVTVDLINGVEHIDATQLPPAPAPDQTAELPRVGKTTIAGKGSSLTAMVPVSCPATEKGGCRTTLTLETAKPARVGGLRAVVVLGTKSVRLAPGGRTNAAIRIARGAGALARRGKLPAKIRIVSSDSAGNTATRTVAVTLKISR